MTLFYLLLDSFSFALPIVFPSRENAGLPGEWLALAAPGARFAGLGGTAVMLPGCGSGGANPAGVASGFGELSLLVSPLAASGQMAFLSVSHPWRPGRYLGFSVASLASGAAEQTDSLGRSIGSFRQMEAAVLLSYAEQVEESWRWGLSAKMVRESMLEYSDYGYGLDVGLLYEPSRFFNFGIAAQNAAAPSLRLKTSRDVFPLVLRAGPRFQFQFGSQIFGLTLESLWQRPGTNLGAARWAAGVEMGNVRRPLLEWRFGANPREWTAGFGLKSGLISFDYAVALRANLGLFHHFGLTFRYGYVSPLAQRNLENQWKLLKAKESELEEAYHRLAASRREAPKQEEQARKEQHQEALQEIEKRKKQLLSEDKLNQAMAAYRLRDYRQALEAAQESLQHQPSVEAQILAMMAKAQILISSRQFDAAQQQLRQVVEMDPEHEEAALLFRRLSFVVGGQ